MKSALRAYLTVSYGLISILVIGSLGSPPKGVQGRASKWHSIAVLTANRRPPERSDAQRTHFALCELDL